MRLLRRRPAGYPGDLVNDDIRRPIEREELELAAVAVAAWRDAVKAGNIAHMIPEPEHRAAAVVKLTALVARLSYSAERMPARNR